MYDLLWAPIAVSAGRELAMSALPEAGNRSAKEALCATCC
jgi:hypothetical protein